MSHKFTTLLAGVLLAGPTVLAAPPGAAKMPPIKFSDTRLDNGLRVIIAEDHFAPVFSIAVSYNVGSRDERPSRTGFAHLFEHMMFKGSGKVGPGEHFFLIFNNGGSMNGTTNTDRTLYFEMLPKNQLDLGLFLEADRMRSLAITQENLDNQRNAVKEERRLGIDNRPYGKTYEKISDLAYDNFAYKHSVIGSMEDLTAATVDDVKEFFRIYYAPNNAVLALVGDLNAADTLTKIKKHFGSIPKQPAPKPVDLTEPAQTAERRAKLDDKLARLTQLNVIHKAPPAGADDAVALGVLNTILAGGESSRLYQRLVKEKEVVTSIFGYLDGRAGPGLHQLIASVRPGKSAAEVEALIAEEIARLHGEPVTNNELQRARSMARRSAAAQRESSLYRAVMLADNAVLHNDPNRINTRLEREMAITAADVTRVARAYLKQTNRTVIETVPAAAQQPAGGRPNPR